MENAKSVIFILLAIAVVGLVAVVSAGKKIPHIEGYHGAIIALFILGFLMCTFGSLHTTISKDPAGPLSILGYLLGLAALVIGILTITNKPVPFIHSERTIFLTLSLIIALKFIITRVHTLFLR